MTRLISPGLRTPRELNPDDADDQTHRVPTSAFVGDRPFTIRFGPSDRAASVQLDL